MTGDKAAAATEPTATTSAAGSNPVGVHAFVSSLSIRQVSDALLNTRDTGGGNKGHPSLWLGIYLW